MNPIVQTFKVLYNYAKKDPRDFVLSIAFMVILMLMVWAGLWFAAIAEGRV
jgi:hypothetical protein